jgi:hypothetical protein
MNCEVSAATLPHIMHGMPAMPQHLAYGRCTLKMLENRTTLDAQGMAEQMWSCWPLLTDYCMRWMKQNTASKPTASRCARV